jgi:hypothetical protein
MRPSISRHRFASPARLLVIFGGLGLATVACSSPGDTGTPAATGTGTGTPTSTATGTATGSGGAGGSTATGSGGAGGSTAAGGAGGATAAGGAGGATASGGAGGATAAGGSGGATGACGAGTMPCGGVCVDTDVDPSNCGACGVACKPGEACGAGACAIVCGGGTMQCGDACVDAMNDPTSCGACGTQCAEGEVCSKGACALVCAGGTTKCGAKCADLADDPANCGACGKACAAGEVCSAGACGLVCGGGTTKCGGKCADLASDPTNCGGCGVTCGAGQLCSGGACALTCGAGILSCGGKCVDPKLDPANCGSCGVACAAGEVCSGGACGLVCAGGTTKCGGKCADVKNDPANCGGCGVTCPPSEACSLGSCAGSCAVGLAKCGNVCVDPMTDTANCGGCGVACAVGASCTAGKCVACDSAVKDCDGDGWLVSEGDCCDKPGLCGNDPERVNPGAIEVVGNGIDDNCNGKTDLFDLEDTVACDANLASNSKDPVDYAKALGICRMTQESPATKKDKTWGLIGAKILRADGSALGDARALSIRPSFGSVSPAPVEGSRLVVMSSGIAADATQTNPGPNGGAPGGDNVSTTHAPDSSVSIGACNQPYCIKDWFAAANAPLKKANELPVAPGCGSGNAGQPQLARDSVMLVLRMRAPTNSKAFSFNSYFLSAEYPEYVCTDYNDQLVALVDTPNGTPTPIANPIDKNLMTYTQQGQKWPIGINIAKGTDLFAVCESQAQNPGCWDPDISGASCSIGKAQLAGTGFEASKNGPCSIGGGTFWLTTAGNVIAGDIVELRISIWDVGDTAFDSLALIDGFQ